MRQNERDEFKALMTQIMEAAKENAKEESPSRHEHEYSIRRLTELTEIHRVLIEKNTESGSKTREELLVLKTKIAIYSTLFGALGTGVVLLIKTFAH